MLRSCEQLEFQMPGHLGVLSKTASPPQDWEFLDSFTSIFDSIFPYLFPDFWPLWTFHKWFQKINFQGFEVQVVHQNSRRIWCWTWIILPQAPPTATKIVGCCDWCFWQTLDRQGAVHCELVAGCTYQGRKKGAIRVGHFFFWDFEKTGSTKTGCMHVFLNLLPFSRTSWRKTNQRCNAVTINESIRPLLHVRNNWLMLKQKRSASRRVLALNLEEMKKWKGMKNQFGWIFENCSVWCCIPMFLEERSWLLPSYFLIYMACSNFSCQRLTVDRGRRKSCAQNVMSLFRDAPRFEVWIKLIKAKEAAEKQKVSDVFLTFSDVEISDVEQQIIRFQCFPFVSKLHGRQVQGVNLPCRSVALWNYVFSPPCFGDTGERQRWKRKGEEWRLRSIPLPPIVDLEKWSWILWAQRNRWCSRCKDGRRYRRNERRLGGHLKTFQLWIKVLKSSIVASIFFPWLNLPEIFATHPWNSATQPRANAPRLWRKSKSICMSPLSW